MSKRRDWGRSILPTARGTCENDVTFLFILFFQNYNCINLTTCKNVGELSHWIDQKVCSTNTPYYLLRNPWSGPYACRGAQKRRSLTARLNASSIMSRSKAAKRAPHPLPRISMVWAGWSRMKWKAWNKKCCCRCCCCCYLYCCLFDLMPHCENSKPITQNIQDECRKILRHRLLSCCFKITFNPYPWLIQWPMNWKRR